MGTILIIKGADFSVNAVADEVLPYKRMVSNVSLASTSQQLVVGSNVIKEQSKVMVDIYIPTPSATCWLFGTKFTANGSFGVGKSANGRLMYGFNKVSSQVNTAEPVSSGRHVITVTKSDILVDNVSVKNDSDVQYNHGDLADVFYVLTINAAASNDNLNLKLYGLKIYSDDGITLTHDLVPAIDLSDKACLFNRVNQEFIYATDNNTLDYEE